jgi:membrane-bound lytic murein transglycosylase MltF
MSLSAETPRGRARPRSLAEDEASAPRMSTLRAALSWALCLLLAGCSPPPARAEDDDLLTLRSLTEERWTGDLDGMIERNLIRVLVVESRTHYFVDGAILRGLDYDLLELFEEELNQKLGRRRVRVNVAYLPVHRGDLIPALLKGRGDLAVANLTITPERRAEVDFGVPWMRDVREIVVTGPASPALQDLEGLSGQTVVAHPASSYSASLAALNERLTREKRPPVDVEAAPEALEDEDLLEMLAGGLVPLVVADDHLARFWAQVYPELTPREDLVVREEGDIAWAFRKKSPRLRAEVDAFIERHRVGSLVANMKLKEYLSSTRHVDGAHGEADRRRFQEVAPIFREHADRYGFDWLLMLAQGYKESNLDQSARSAAGAVGIMQLLPATGAAMDVGDIRQPEANVHAGIKYMRQMIDRSFADADLEGEDQALFALASYNAGPARVAGLRREAAEKGLDPNRWFDHVEKIAARRIGRETVVYVRDVYKYYVAYSLSRESQEARESARPEEFGNAKP